MDEERATAAAQYFDHDSEAEREIRTLAAALYRRAGRFTAVGSNHMRHG